MTTRSVAYNDVALICEADEQWSFVGNKKNRHWLWYAFGTKRKQVIAHTFGPRNDESCRRLLALPEPFSMGFITTDDWAVMNGKCLRKFTCAERYLPSELSDIILIYARISNGWHVKRYVIRAHLKCMKR